MVSLYYCILTTVKVLHLTLCLLAAALSSSDNLWKQFVPRSVQIEGPHSQTVKHSDRVSKTIFLIFWKYSADNKSIINYPECKELICMWQICTKNKEKESTNLSSVAEVKILSVISNGWSWKILSVVMFCSFYWLLCFFGHLYHLRREATLVKPNLSSFS